MEAPKPRVLLVDDDSVFTEVMTRGFSRRGFDTCCAHSAEQALQHCTAFQPSHIVLDLNMPGTSGLVVLPQLLALSPQALLVVLTGYSSIATAVEATKSGAVNYLCKPASIEEVLQAFGDNAETESVDIAHQPPSIERLEWEHIQKVLADHQGNVSATARALGMHRRTLQRKLQKKPVRR